MKKRKRKSLSPVIATVLLISIVIVIAVIIFLWAKSFVKEEGTKFGKNIRLVCEDVDFEASYTDDGKLNLVNTGNVPIFRVKIKSFNVGSFQTSEIKLSDEPEIGLRQGETISRDVSSYISGSTTKILIIPVLLGSSGRGERIYPCEEVYGYEIEI